MTEEERTISNIIEIIKDCGKDGVLNVRPLDLSWWTPSLGGFHILSLQLDSFGGINLLIKGDSIKFVDIKDVNGISNDDLLNYIYEEIYSYFEF